MNTSPRMLPWEPQENREWRALLRVVGFVTLPQKFALGDAACSSEMVGNWPDSRHVLLITSTYSSSNIETANYEAHDLAEELADRIAFLGLAAVEISVLSVTYPKVEVGELLEIALAVPDAIRTPVEIRAEELAQFDKPRTDPDARALRLFRTGASSSSSYHALGQLWAAAEVLGRELAVQAGSYTEYPCKNCGATQKGPPRTQPHIESFFEAVLEAKSTRSPSETAEAARKTRGKVIHGGKLQDRVLREDVENQLGHLQCGVAVALSRAMGVTSSIRHARRIDRAVMYAQVVARQEMAAREGGTVFADMHFGKWAVSARGALPSIPKNVGRDQPHEIGLVGLPFPMLIPNLWLPIIYNPENAG